MLPVQISSAGHANQSALPERSVVSVLLEQIDDYDMSVNHATLYVNSREPTPRQRPSSGSLPRVSVRRRREPFQNPEIRVSLCESARR